MLHTQHLRIAIIGAGPAGATLARLLQQRGYRPIIFERETSPNQRQQGGSLDLHRGSGLAAIHQAGLDAQFQLIARPHDQGHRILDQAATILFEDDDDQARPEVDRTELRAMLLDSLLPGSVRWNSKIDTIRRNADATHTLMLHDGASETFDLVVGADGAWSRVRPLLSNASPVYAGVSFIELGIDAVDQQHPDVATLLGRGTMTAVANQPGLRMVAQRNAHSHVRVYVIMHASLEDVQALGIDAAEPEQTRQKLRALFADWSPRLQRIIDVCNDTVAVRSLYMLPVGHCWAAYQGATLIGDAAHLMTPFSGQGVNLAMQDALELAQAIHTHGDLNDALHAYEQPMFARATRAAERAAEGLSRTINSDAQGVVAYFRQFTPA